MKRRQEQWGLLALPVIWAIVWIVLHYFRPTAFPWLGVIGGLVIAIPLLIAVRIEQRSTTGRKQQDQDNDTRT